MAKKADKQSDSLIKEEFAKAMALKGSGKLAASMVILEKLIVARSKSAKLRCALGGVYWDLKKYAPAIKQFSVAVDISPTSELASLGLFHCLWEQGKRDLAFDEMKRFMLVSDSDDYREIVRELNQTEN